MENEGGNKYNGYNPYNTYEGYEITKKDKGKNEVNDSDEQINIKIDKKGKGHEKGKQSENYGFIGSKSSSKYSNPYDNNVYGDFSKKEKKGSKKINKKRSSSGTGTDSNNTMSDDADASQNTQTQLANGATVPVMIYPQQLTTVPTVYYTTPVAIQYVNSPSLGYQEGSNSSSTELTKEKRESKRMISYYADKENATEKIIKSDDKEKELEEIMNELGMKKDKEPKDLKSRLLRNQLFIFVSLLILFVILVILYIVWPRLPDIVVTEFELQPDGIQYKLPMSIEYRDGYTDLTNVTSSDIDSYVQFNMVVHFNVKNDNFIPYSFNSLFIEYVLKSESLSNNVLLGDDYVDSISFGSRKNALMTITTSLRYAARNMKNDNTFRFILDRCGITSPGSDMDLDYKVTMKIPIVSTIYRPSYIKTTSFRCPFLNDDRFKIVEKKNDDDEKDDNDKKGKSDDWDDIK